MKIERAPRKRVLLICSGKACSEKHDASEVKSWFKARIKEKGLEEKVRACVSSCMDYCDMAPNFVLYPEGRWYSFTDQGDREAIFADLIKDL